MSKKVNNKKLVKKCLKKVIEGLLLATIVTTVTPLTVNAEVKSSATTVKKVSRKNFVKDCYSRNKTLSEVLTLMEENTIDAANDMWNLENYLTENNTSVGGTLADNSKLIDNSINMFRLTKEEETILRKKFFSPSATRDDIKRYILNAYLEYKLVDYSNYRSINLFKKMLTE